MTTPLEQLVEELERLNKDELLTRRRDRIGLLVSSNIDAVVSALRLSSKAGRLEQSCLSFFDDAIEVEIDASMRENDALKKTVETLTLQLAKTRADAIEEAAKVCESPNAGLVPPDGGAPTPREMLANVAAEIRALLQPKQE